ncbi:unnamed protein product [Linum trigynum]|uniref:Uncharacterized protein n=1 Tax=Linum trigynum TaxID=586398 RepID=A0AAV2ELE4_9ROSI
MPSGARPLQQLDAIFTRSGKTISADPVPSRQEEPLPAVSSMEFFTDQFQQMALQFQQLIYITNISWLTSISSSRRNGNQRLIYRLRFKI